MPVISCGGMRYQFKWQDVDPKEIPRENQENLEACIHRALELGINHIETARGYGTSEMQLGNVLPKLPRDKIIVQTKVTPQGHARRNFSKTFETSMKYLKLDHVDLLSLHGINNRELLDWSLKKNGCLAAARQLQKEGRARFIGFSTHAHDGHHSGSGEHRRVRLRQRPLVFRERPELGRRLRPRTGWTWASSSSARTTRAGNFTSRRQRWWNSARRCRRWRSTTFTASGERKSTR